MEEPGNNRMNSSQHQEPEVERGLFLYLEAFNEPENRRVQFARSASQLERNDSVRDRRDRNRSRAIVIPFNNVFEKGKVYATKRLHNSWARIDGECIKSGDHATRTKEAR